MRDGDDGADPFTQDYRLLGRCISASYPQLATRKRRLADAEDPGLLGQLFQYEKLTRSERTSLLEPYHYHSTPSFVYEFMHASDRFLYRHETAPRGCRDGGYSARERALGGWWRSPGYDTT
ncbi:hypothetical protein PG987_000632 [Apiospora arundinis]